MNGTVLSVTVKVPGNCVGEGDEEGGGGGEGGEDGTDANTKAKFLNEEIDSLNIAMDVTEDTGIQIKKELLKSEKNDIQEDAELTKMDLDADEAVEGGADIDDKELSMAGGKKKGTRKKRSINWEEGERSLLLEVIKPKADFVENRSVDAKSIKAKHLAWLHITKQFNILNFRHRSMEQIKVQWRSMKNIAKREYQQKYPKDGNAEGRRLVAFMEEMQKDVNILRAQPRNPSTVKKENIELDDEDTPLAALPSTATTNGNDENSTQTSENVALPSPPLSASESQNDMPKETPASSRKRKKPVPQPAYKGKAPQSQTQQQINTTTTDNNLSTKTKRQRTISGKKELISESNNNSNCNDSTNTSIEQSPLAMALIAGTENSLSPTIANNNSMHSATNATIDMVKYAVSHTNNLNGNSNSSNTNTINNNNNNINNLSNSCSTINTSNLMSSLVTDEKYKKQLFELLKRARLTEMDYVRREHEQKIRFTQMEQELKLNFYRQSEELKLRFVREEHELRMRQCQLEHEARMHIYASNLPLKRMNAKAASLDVNATSETHNFN